MWNVRYLTPLPVNRYDTSIVPAKIMSSPWNYVHVHIINTNPNRANQFFDLIARRIHQLAGNFMIWRPVIKFRNMFGRHYKRFQTSSDEPVADWWLAVGPSEAADPNYSTLRMVDGPDPLSIDSVKNKQHPNYPCRKVVSDQFGPPRPETGPDLKDFHIDRPLYPGMEAKIQ